MKKKYIFLIGSITLFMIINFLFLKTASSSVGKRPDLSNLMNQWEQSVNQWRENTLATSAELGKNFDFSIIPLIETQSLIKYHNKEEIKLELLNQIKLHVKNINADGVDGKNWSQLNYFKACLFCYLSGIDRVSLLNECKVNDLDLIYIVCNIFTELKTDSDNYYKNKWMKYRLEKVDPQKNK